jgi:hypothetical protein
MRRSVFRGWLVLAAVSLTTWACDKVDSTTTPTPTPTPNITETFDGTLSVNGAATFPFTVAGGGQVTAQVATLAPDSAVMVGLGLGVWDGTTCTLGRTNDNSSQGSTVIANVSGAGALCARIYDVGKLADSATFEIQVVHP